MRPTYGNLVAIFRSHPAAAEATRLSGCTPEQAAAIVLDNMSSAPSGQARDRIFSEALGAAGIYTAGVEAFDRGTEQMLRDMSNRESTERHAHRMSEDSRRMPAYSSPERIAKLRDVAARSSLTQGLGDRLRASDRHLEQHDGKGILPARALIDRDRDDRRDLRSALLASVASTAPDRYALNLHHDENRSLRDTLREAFTADDIRTEDADPLTDERLLSMSDAI
jgi:hypothetical protein